MAKKQLDFNHSLQYKLALEKQKKSLMFQCLWSYNWLMIYRLDHVFLPVIIAYCQLFAPGKLGENNYIQHHSVIRDDKITAKIHVVFNASGRDNGPSLNEVLFKWPHLTPLLYNIPLRFRSHVVALTSSIEKAFLQINVNENDGDYLRFLWFDNIFSDQPKIVRNRFALVVFGVTS